MKHLLLVFSVFCITGGIWAQHDGRNPLQGIISIGAITADIDEISIQNLQTKQKVLSTNGGYFTISAKAGDSLIFIAQEAIGMKMKLTNANVGTELLVVKLTPVSEQLKEVKVDNVNAANQKFTTNKPKEYTPAERKLKNAKTVAPTRKSTEAYTAIGTDPLINKLSGRTSELKKRAQVEKKEISKAKLSEMYEKNHFTEILKIPEAYLEGFLFYAVEDKRFVNTLDSGYQEQIDYQLANLATAYKKILNGEGN